MIVRLKEIREHQVPEAMHAIGVAVLQRLAIGGTLTIDGFTVERLPKSWRVSPAAMVWHAKVLPMVEKGMTVPQIAHDLGATRAAVANLCWRHDWTPTKCPRGRRVRHDMADFDELGTP